MSSKKKGERKKYDDAKSLIHGPGKNRQKTGGGWAGK